MGLFGKLKDILFEEEEDDEMMPVYTEKDVGEEPKKEEKVFHTEEVETKPVDGNRFKNVKRDIDISFDEKDVYDELPSVTKSGETRVVPSVADVKPREESRTVFQSFDEDEFDRINSKSDNKEQVTARELPQTREVKNSGINSISLADARKANSNFSSTSTARNTKVELDEPSKITVSPRLHGKKPFTPSPVISPVYGILDKNYTKDDIKDKKDGIKRERVNKPKKAKIEETPIEEMLPKEIVPVDIDSVRQKAYGELEEMENTIAKEEALEKKTPIVEEPINEVEKVVNNIEDEIEDVDIDNTNVYPTEASKPVEEKQTTEEKKQPKVLDEMEKTSTLQILDDIEKELNSIKPISEEEEIKEDEDIKEKIEKSETLENDLFNLIDSMYEEGEEEENG